MERVRAAAEAIANIFTNWTNRVDPQAELVGAHRDFVNASTEQHTAVAQALDSVIVRVEALEQAQPADTRALEDRVADLEAKITALLNQPPANTPPPPPAG